eukprot:scaffold29779_cov26-Attheya_sp.AAC.3
MSSKCFSRVKEWFRDGRLKPLWINSAFVGKVFALPLMLPDIGSQLSYSGDGGIVHIKENVVHGWDREIWRCSFVHETAGLAHWRNSGKFGLGVAACRGAATGLGLGLTGEEEVGWQVGRPHLGRKMVTRHDWRT